MKKQVTSFLIAAYLATQTVPIGAQPSVRPGEGVAPAALGKPCTAPNALRGSRVPPPKAGDVATIPQLCAGGVSAASLPHAPSIVPPATTVGDGTLTQNQSLPQAIALGAPASTGIDIRTINGNWTHLFSGSFWHAPSITSHGELQSIDSGHASFSVASALGYFAVVMPRFLARVKGTIFDVDYEPGQSAKFHVQEGSVAIIELLTVHLELENRTIDGVRQTKVINANGQNSIEYKLPQQTLQFKNLQQAQQTFQAQLDAATADGDPQLVDDALNNIQLVTGRPVLPPAGYHPPLQGSQAAAGGAGTSSIVIPAIAFAAAVAAVAVVTTQSKGNTTVVPVSTPTGSLTLTSTTHKATSPSPSPAIVVRPSPSIAPSPSPSPTPKAAPALHITTVTAPNANLPEPRPH